MTNQRILEKAIQKAIDGGWKEGLNAHHWLESLRSNNLNWNDIRPDIPGLIFNHQFAKSLWGEEYPSKVEATINRDFPCWKRRLQEMVIDDEPITYLGNNL